MQAVKRVRALEGVPQLARASFCVQCLDEGDGGGRLVRRQQEKQLRLEGVGVRGRDAQYYIPLLGPIRRMQRRKRTLITRPNGLRVMPSVDLRAEGGKETLQLVREGDGCLRLGSRSMGGFCSGRSLGFGCWHHWRSRKRWMATGDTVCEVDHGRRDQESGADVAFKLRSSDT